MAFGQYRALVACTVGGVYYRAGEIANLDASGDGTIPCWFAAVDSDNDANVATPSADEAKNLPQTRTFPAASSPAIPVGPPDPGADLDDLIERLGAADSNEAMNILGANISALDDILVAGGLDSPPAAEDKADVLATTATVLGTAKDLSDALAPFMDPDNPANTTSSGFGAGTAGYGVSEGETGFTNIQLDLDDHVVFLKISDANKDALVTALGGTP